MENASKAILIAGGVLVAIIVISIAIYIFKMGTDAFSTIEENKLEALKEEQTIKFSQYIGTVYGSEVENCIRRVLNYNKVNSTNIEVSFKYSPGGEKVIYNKLAQIIDVDTNLIVLNAQIRNDIFSGTITTDPNTGLISSIDFVRTAQK